MFMGKLKKHKKVIWSWYKHERDLNYPSNRVMYSLKWYTKHCSLPDYGYQGSWRGHLEYACDRMNGGRALSILRLIKDEKEKNDRKK